MRELYTKWYFPYFVICVLTILTTGILWLPFLLHSSSIYGIPTPNISMATIYSHWDGPLYIIPAKTWYNVQSALMNQSPLGLDKKYFAAHLPLYPLTIAMLAPVFGYLKGMLVSTVLFSCGLLSVFYFIVKRFNLSTKPLLLTCVLLFITPRFFVIRSIGSPEPMFMMLILLSMFFFAKKRLWWAGLLGGLAIMTKTPAGLLFIAYGLYLAIKALKKKKVKIKWLGILLIPAGFLAVCTLYLIQMGSFWAYFQSGDNIHLVFPPFQVFNHTQRWIGDGWLEEIIFVYAFYALSISYSLSYYSSSYRSIVKELWAKFYYNFGNRDESERFKTIYLVFAVVYFMAIIHVQHRDIARYSLPLLPFALITFEKFFTTKRFWVVLLFLIPAIYAYAWNFMLINIAPITDWAPFL